MRVRYASRIVTRVLTLVVMTASLTTNARVSATFQESTGTLNDQPSSPRLLALRDRLNSGDRTALDKFWNEIKEQGGADN